jgi:hypothetical protein
MNIWVTKNIKFGWKYSSDKQARQQIDKSIKWLFNTIKKKSKTDDCIIIAGGLFSNTNPSLVTINDAKLFITEIAKYIKVYLAISNKDCRMFDNEQYYAPDLFIDLINVNIIKDVITIENVNIIPYPKSINNKEIYLDVECSKLKNIDIPSFIQFDEFDGKPGLLIYNTITDKYIFLENILSSKHITLTINNIEELKNVDLNKIKNDNVHIILNKNLIDEYKAEVDIILFKINPVSIKYIEQEKKEEKVNIENLSKTLDIKEAIYDNIKEKPQLMLQFERILQIYKNR